MTVRAKVHVVRLTKNAEGGVYVRLECGHDAGISVGHIELVTVN